MGFLVGFIVFLGGLFKKKKKTVGFFGSGFFTTTLILGDLEPNFGASTWARWL